MKLECQVKVSDEGKRNKLLEILNQMADCHVVGDAVFASYCGANHRLADSIIAVVQQYRDHKIQRSAEG